MFAKAVTSVAFALAVTACVAPESSAVRTETTTSVAFAPGYHQIDFVHEIWGTQSFTPPPGLVTVRQGDLIGRNIQDASGTPVMVVQYLLVDPATGEARYAVASSSDFGDFVAVPVSALQITPSAVSVDITLRQLRRVPRYSLASLESRYPLTTLTTVTTVSTTATAPAMTPLPPVTAPVVVTAPTVVAAPTVVTTTTTAPSTLPAEPLELAHRGSVVGYPVIDSFGQSVGVIDAVAAVPATGEVRYAIISGPTFGPGYFIAAPAARTSMSDGRVVLAGSLATWSQAPRYRGDQIQQSFGALGNVD